MFTVAVLLSTGPPVPETVHLKTALRLPPPAPNVELNVVLELNAVVALMLVDPDTRTHE